MPSYVAPLRDMRFLLHQVFGAAEAWASMPDLAGRVDAEIADSILEEGAKIANQLLAPLNRSGDEEGAQWVDGKVRTPDGFKKAYVTFAEGGWNGLTGNPEYGGMGMPKMLSAQLEEMLYASNCGFYLYAVLSVSAALAIDAHASEALRRKFLPKLYTGQWSGTMCLTEAHAGTDLGMIRTRAHLQVDGSYSITGTKIFITSGEHDLTENIIHLVLAKLPDAPSGTKGISLFLVPKNTVNDDGSLGERNALNCSSIEHKMGVKASATCMINFEGAKGWLIGEANKGLAAMFTMMNYQRLSCGLQGVGCADASYQNAVSYARERLQGRAAKGPLDASKPADPILAHPDIRRMLISMKATIEAGRALSTYLGLQLDIANFGTNNEERTRAEALAALLTPVAKAFNTDIGLDNCILGQQVFGGHGYIRDWGQEQLVRDVRIAQIYEGANGIQALDLVARKIIPDQGASLEMFLVEVSAFTSKNAPPNYQSLLEGVCRLRHITNILLEQTKNTPNEIGSAAVEYLHILGYVAYGYMWARMATIAKNFLKDDPDFYGAKLATAEFYFTRIMPRSHGLESSVAAGSASLYALQDTQF
ncbi:acyl-CoA dehydrogenase [Pseudomonas ogarae]|uniref:acyl-CoA dehydrogenase C-terminal domain-containing protein n=1 Tax=Pseudomonas ogarae (strain DSM 112162 / CECT 30235 / F113) TaxID=1114970 RepID=UPI0009A30F7C|nr:acyl-CoA dehydrogenase C-terminal domain-containing protein [Pseudomonas ogarae]OPG72100.1 acyl-CoA dehydrogenase [Pseudomonas ogarae]